MAVYVFFEYGHCANAFKVSGGINMRITRLTARMGAHSYAPACTELCAHNVVEMSPECHSSIACAKRMPQLARGKWWRHGKSDGLADRQYRCCPAVGSNCLVKLVCAICYPGICMHAGSEAPL